MISYWIPDLNIMRLKLGESRFVGLNLCCHAKYGYQIQIVTLVNYSDCRFSHKYILSIIRMIFTQQLAVLSNSRN